ncbi:MAG: Hsp20/alpha crystallin family protein [Deltaproteobacteria bacterium]|nr:Hsp20/alpha crystallin family protein [Deltaproteobacteria bacterium]
MRELLPILRRTGLWARPQGDLFDRFFEDFRLPSLLHEEREWVPAFDVSETQKEVIVKAEVPGMNKKDIDITLSDGLLTVKGERKQEEQEESENYHLVETRYGAFSRTMRLPCEVDADKVDATYRDGLLKIRLPKSQSARERKVEIKS